MNKWLFLISLASLHMTACAQKPEPVFIPATNPGIQYIGRFDFTVKEKPVFMYSGSAIKTMFTGTSISLLMKDDSLRNWFTVKLDDSLFIFQSDKKSGVYLLGSHLNNKKHHLEISRRTEWHGGNTEFSGFYIDSGDRLLTPEKNKRTIEFIGDSYTCGYGNECDTTAEHFSYPTENNYASFGAITARAMGANYVGICRSGIGVIQNYGGTDKSFTQPNLYDEVVVHSKVRWDYTKDPPQVVVIDLGANDLSVKLDSVDFVNTYIRFVRKIRSQYPYTKIICTAGPSSLHFGDEWIKFQSLIRPVVSHFKNVDDKVYYFKFSPFDPKGCDFHPNLKQHQQMADELILFIKTIANW